MDPIGIVVVEASRWEMTPLHEFLSWQWIQSESSPYDYESQLFDSSCS
jgi:hypothetical protein